MNSRSSVSRLASSAPSHRIAGPSRDSSARSGPTANGISTTTVRKNSTPISAPPPTRSAIRMYRRMRAARAVMGCLPNERAARPKKAEGPSESCHPPDPQLPRLNPERGVGGGHDHAASSEVIAHQAAEHVLAGHVQRRGRLVQQPDRAADGEQPGQRQPAALAGGQEGGGEISGVVEADRSEAFSRVKTLSAQEIGPE